MDGDIREVVEGMKNLSEQWQDMAVRNKKLQQQLDEQKQLLERKDQQIAQVCSASPPEMEF
jgi:uncharacterized protein (DUF3084 family)